MMSPRNGGSGGGAGGGGNPTTTLFGYGATAQPPPLLPPPPPVKPPAVAMFSSAPPLLPPPPHQQQHHQQQQQWQRSFAPAPAPAPSQHAPSAARLPPGAAPPILAGHVEDTLPPPPPLMRPNEMQLAGLGIQGAVGGPMMSGGHKAGGEAAADDDDEGFEEDEELARAMLIAPPSIPALPASPSLDMAYFEGSQNGRPPPPPPSRTHDQPQQQQQLQPAAPSFAAAPVSPTSPTSAVLSSYLASSPDPPHMPALPRAPVGHAGPSSSSSTTSSPSQNMLHPQPQRRTSRASTSLAGTLNRRPSLTGAGGLVPVKFSPTKAQVMAQQQQQQQQRDTDQEILSPVGAASPRFEGRSSPARQRSPALSRMDQQEVSNSFPGPSHIHGDRSSPARRPSPAASPSPSARPVMNIIASSPARPMAAPSQPQRDRLRALPPIDTNGHATALPAVALPRQPNAQTLLSPHSAAAQDLPRRGASLARPPGTLDSPKMDAESTPTEAALSAILDEMLENSSPALGGPSRLPARARAPRHKPKAIRRRTRRATFCDILVEEGVQASLFPRLNVSTFLALLGSIPTAARRCISGEVVGRWVCGEWGITLDGDESWPGLGVWEGFLESLLHDPEAYATYPPRLHHLLEHLCLSHTLVVLFLRTLPSTAFPLAPPFPFEDESSLGASGLPTSVSNLSIAHNARRGVASEAGFPPKMPVIPKAERVVELVMPTPLSTAPPPPDPELPGGPPPVANRKLRRSSVGSASFVSWNRNKSAASDTGSIFNDAVGGGASQVHQTAKGSLPPVSFPSAKRYHFRGYDKSPRSRTSSESGRPGSTWSQDESIAGRSRRDMMPPPPVPQIPRFIGNGSVSQGRHSPTISSNLRPDRTASSSPSYQSRSSATDPAFDKPVPFIHGRAPLLRVFVPLSAEIPKWPSAQAAARVRRELERCGAWGKLRIGDVIINTALAEPLVPRHLMLFVPTMSPFLVPIEFRQSAAGHLPAYVDALRIPPSYHFPLLPEPQIVHLDLSPWAAQALGSLRLTFERRDITTARGERVAAKRYLHVAGFDIRPENAHHACEEWHGMVTLESEGTAEGRAQILARLGGSGGPAQVGPWQVVRDKCMGGTVWLRLVSPPKQA